MDNIGIRHLMDEKISVDADLTAFLIDYYPHVYRLMSSKMSRTEKINLLLEREINKEHIANCIYEYTRAAQMTAISKKSTNGFIVLALACAIFAICHFSEASRSRHRKDLQIANQSIPIVDSHGTCQSTEGNITIDTHEHHLRVIENSAKHRTQPITKAPNFGSRKVKHRYDINGPVQFNDVRATSVTITQNNM